MPCLWCDGPILDGFCLHCRMPERLSWFDMRPVDTPSATNVRVVPDRLDPAAVLAEAELILRGDA